MSDDKTKNCIFCGGTVEFGDPLAGGEALTQCIFDGILGNFMQRRPGKTIFLHKTCEVPRSLEQSLPNNHSASTDCVHCKMPPLFHQSDTKACPIFSGSRWFFDTERHYTEPSH